MKLVRALLVVLLGLAALGGLPTTTSASDATSATYVYDGLTIARVDGHPIDGAEAPPTRPSDVWGASAPPSQLAGGASTTPARSFIATEAADDVLRLGTKDSWGNLNTLDDHFARHGADFGPTSADDYARQASEFLQQPGTLTKIDPKTGVIRVYDPATEAFGAYSPTGTTRTFYIPDPAKHGYPTNLDYWNAQPG